MGLVTYVTGDFGAETFRGLDMEKEIDALARIPIGQKLYVRPTWRELQKRPGRLDPEEYWKATFAAAKQYGKRVGFRVMMGSPDIAGPALPDFVLERVPMVRLKGEWKRSGREGARQPAFYEEPRYDHPVFQEAFRELNSLLAAELDGNPLVEYLDTFLYGFWGEGHTWPFTNHPFPDDATAERTFVRMFEVQLENWKKTPLVTNTQPDWSRVGNSEVVDRTIRSHNWLRTDTVFIENEQIEALSNRPPWVAAILEVSMADGTARLARARRGRDLDGQRHRPRPRPRRQLLVALELAQGESRERAALLPAVSGKNRRDRPADRLPRAPVVDLVLRREGPERSRDRLRQRRHRRRSRRPARDGPRRRGESSRQRRPRPRLAGPGKDPPGAAAAAAKGSRGRGSGSRPSSRSRARATRSAGPVGRSSSPTGRCGCVGRAASVSGGSRRSYSGSASRRRWCRKESSRLAFGPSTEPRSRPVS